MPPPFLPHHAQEKNRYKDAFNSLRDHKREIEHLHMMLEQSRVRLQRDFEQWLGLMARQGMATGGSLGLGPGSMGSAQTSPAVLMASMSSSSSSVRGSASSNQMSPAGGSSYSGSAAAASRSGGVRVS